MQWWNLPSALGCYSFPYTSIRRHVNILCACHGASLHAIWLRSFSLTCLVFHSPAKYSPGEVVSVLRTSQTMKSTELRWQETKPTLLEAASTAWKLLFNIIRWQGAPSKDAPRPPKIPQAARVLVCNRTSAEEQVHPGSRATETPSWHYTASLHKIRDARSTWILQARAIAAPVTIRCGCTDHAQSKTWANLSSSRFSTGHAHQYLMRF